MISLFVSHTIALQCSKQYSVDLHDSRSNYISFAENKNVCFKVVGNEPDNKEKLSILVDSKVNYKLSVYDPKGDIQIIPESDVNSNEKIVTDAKDCILVLSFNNTTDSTSKELVVSQIKPNKRLAQQISEKNFSIQRKTLADSKKTKIIIAIVVVYIVLWIVSLAIFISLACWKPNRAIRAGILYPCFYNCCCPYTFDKSFDYYVYEERRKPHFQIPFADLCCSTACCECFCLTNQAYFVYRCIPRFHKLKILEYLCCLCASDNDCNCNRCTDAECVFFCLCGLSYLLGVFLIFLIPIYWLIIQILMPIWLLWASCLICHRDDKDEKKIEETIPDENYESPYADRHIRTAVGGSVVDNARDKRKEMQQDEKDAKKDAKQREKDMQKERERMRQEALEAMRRAEEHPEEAEQDVVPPQQSAYQPRENSQTPPHPTNQIPQQQQNVYEQPGYPPQQYPAYNQPPPGYYQQPPPGYYQQQYPPPPQSAYQYPPPPQ